MPWWLFQILCPYTQQIGELLLFSPFYHSSRQRAGVLAVAEHLLAIHKHMLHAGRVMMRLLVGRVILNGCWIEDYNVRKIIRLEPASLGDM